MTSQNEPYEVPLRHIAKWDRLDIRTGNVTGACFVGGPLGPGQSLTMPAKEWDRMGRPDEIVFRVWPIAAASPEDENARLRVLLTEAADDIESWGAYASPYLQKKHHLAETVAAYREAASEQKDGEE